MVLTHPWSELNEGKLRGACTAGSAVAAYRQIQNIFFSDICYPAESKQKENVIMVCHLCCHCKASKCYAISSCLTVTQPLFYVIYIMTVVQKLLYCKPDTLRATKTYLSVIKNNL